MITLDMKTFLTMLAVLAAVAFVGCGDDDNGDNDAPPVADGPTTLTLDKAFTSDGDIYTFVVQVRNTGENDAVLFVLSDIWEEGLAVESIGDFGGTMADPVINDAGFEVLLDRFEPGEQRDITYRARCVESGEWRNTAAVSAQNVDPQETSVSISCP